MNKKVILVGPSGSLLKNKLGEKIDSYDVVCRMNHAGRPEIFKNNKYRNYIGNKKNIWFLNQQGRFRIMYPDLYDQFIVFRENDEFQLKCEKLHKEFNNISKKLTCGQLSIIWLLERYPYITICGMDGFKGGHFYKDEFKAFKRLNQDENDKLVASGKGAHDPHREQEYRDYLIKEGKIKILENE